MCYPLFFKFSGRNILVFGAGKVALRKVKSILSLTKPNMTIISLDFEDGFYSLPVKLVKKKASISDITADYDFIFICTNDRKLNHTLFLKAKELSIPVNVADNQNECDFFTSATIKFGDIVIAISTQGKNPSKSKEFKEKLLKALKSIDF
ncbi:precorrin-2 dehydrogenase/sirohydrochlorin ferrochelatase family protein [Hippea alviniae]|uniref:precorrin-2 dehydrogenase/sirohydrochlorin ferrochelatase family protein n=1 Tax=Hippea alviniae TaxID=1279027 RepID=UPI0003B5D6F5|nr:bifunctional precorrin-2 dehydrogenase/sirohydrochlorin ferrochelatase [Hippea alviniae]